MEIPKAIVELTIPDDVILIKVTPEFQKAVKLGREALKLVKNGREEGFTVILHRMPGETED